MLENLYVRQFIYDEVEGDDLIAYYVKNKKENEKQIEKFLRGNRNFKALEQKQLLPGGGTDGFLICRMRKEH